MIRKHPFGLMAVLCIAGSAFHFAQNKGDEGGGGDDDELTATAKAIQKTQKEISENVENWSKQTKQAAEDLTKLKNDTTASLGELEIAVKKVQKNLQLETRAALSGSIRARRALLLDNEEKCLAFLGQMAKAMNYPVPKRIADAMEKALTEGSSPGSTLILDKDIAREVYDTLLMYGQWNTLGVRRLATKVTKFPVKTARPVANWLTSEAATISDDSTKAGTSVDCTVLPIAVLINVSLQLIDDGEIDVIADIIDDFAEAIGFRLDYTAFQGDGTNDATNGAMTGVFGFGTSVVAASGHTTIEAMDYTDVLKCLTGIDAAVLMRPARWWMHPTTIARMIAIKDSNGRPIFQTGLEAPAGGVGSIFGYPVTPVGAAPSANTTSSKVAAFGDPNAYVVGIRKDTEIQASDEARWTTYERSFRGVQRAGCKGRRATGLTVLTNAAS